MIISHHIRKFETLCCSYADAESGRIMEVRFAWSSDIKGADNFPGHIEGLGNNPLSRHAITGFSKEEIKEVLDDYGKEN